VFGGRDSELLSVGERASCDLWERERVVICGRQSELCCGRDS